MPLLFFVYLVCIFWGMISFAQDLSSVLDDIMTPVLSGQDGQHEDFVETWMSQEGIGSGTEVGSGDLVDPESIVFPSQYAYTVRGPQTITFTGSEGIVTLVFDTFSGALGISLVESRRLVNGIPYQAISVETTGDAIFTYRLFLPNKRGTTARVLWRNASNPVWTVMPSTVQGSRIMVQADHFTTFVVTSPTAPVPTGTGCILLGAAADDLCFTSLQAAINQATGDGAVVRVFGGTYVGDVVISGRNSASLEIRGMEPGVRILGNMTATDDFITIRDIEQIAGDVILSGASATVRLVGRVDGSLWSQGLNHRVEDIGVIDGIVRLEGEGHQYRRLGTVRGHETVVFSDGLNMSGSVLVRSLNSILDGIILDPLTSGSVAIFAGGAHNLTVSNIQIPGRYNIGIRNRESSASRWENIMIDGVDVGYELRSQLADVNGLSLIQTTIQNSAFAFIQIDPVFELNGVLIDRSIIRQNQTGFVFGSINTVQFRRSELIDHRFASIVNTSMNEIDADYVYRGTSGGRLDFPVSNGTIGLVRADIFPALRDSSPNGGTVGYGPENNWGIPSFVQTDVDRYFRFIQGATIYDYVRHDRPFAFSGRFLEDQMPNVCTFSLAGVPSMDIRPAQADWCIFTGISFVARPNGGFDLTFRVRDSHGWESSFNRRLIMDRTPPHMVNDTLRFWDTRLSTWRNSVSHAGLQWTNAYPQVWQRDANFANLTTTSPLLRCQTWLEMPGGLVREQGGLTGLTIGRCVVSYTGLVDGEYRFWSTGTDWVGWVGETFDVRTFSVDTQMPMITLSSLATGTASHPLFAPSVRVTVSDNVRVDSVRGRWVAPGTNCAALSDTEYQFSLMSGTFGTSSGVVTLTEQARDGQWLCIQARDLVWNVAYATVGPFRIDRLTPTGTISSQLTARNCPSCILLTGTIADNFPVGLIDWVSVRLYGSGGDRIFSGIVLPSGEWEVRVPVMVPQGIYAVRVTAYDRAGNIGVWQSPNGLIVDPSVIVLLTAPSDGMMTSGAGISLEAICVSSAAQEAGVGCTRAEFIITNTRTNQQETHLLTYPTPGTDRFVLMWTGSDDQWTIRVRGTDAVGNESLSPQMHTFVIDTQAPVITASGLLTDPRPTQLVTWDIRDRFVDDVGFFLVSGAMTPCPSFFTGWLGRGGSGDQMTGSFVFDQAASDAHVVCLYARDRVGNIRVTRLSQPLVIDRVGPRLSLIPDTNAFCRQGHFLFSLYLADQTPPLVYSLDFGSGWTTYSGVVTWTGQAGGISIQARDLWGNISQLDEVIKEPDCRVPIVQGGGGGGGGGTIVVYQDRGSIGGGWGSITSSQRIRETVSVYDWRMAQCLRINPLFQRIRFVDLPQGMQDPAYDLLSLCTVWGVGNDGTMTRVRFGSEERISRAEVLKILVNVARHLRQESVLVDGPSSRPFDYNDTLQNDWYGVYLEQALARGWMHNWVKEHPNGTFSLELYRMARVDDIRRMMTDVARTVGVFPPAHILAGFPSTYEMTRGEFAFYVINAFGLEGDYFLGSDQSNNRRLLELIAQKVDPLINPRDQERVLRAVYRWLQTMDQRTVRAYNLDIRSMIKVLDTVMLDMGFDRRQAMMRMR
ncbi:MAG: hypothetical protein NZL83_02440 [Candidatus Absconditabacterales bacterium]|nr:hypothetical protein [Candidatus Absconditabacterales bacterium]